MADWPSKSDSAHEYNTALLHPPLDSRPPAAFLPLLLLLFVGSGCAALIYEIVWLQLLQLAIGSSAVSLGVLLGTYMGGMCLGSLLLPRLVSKASIRCAFTRKLELGIGIFAIVVLFLIPMLDSAVRGDRQARHCRACFCVPWSRRSACFRPRS